MRSILVLVFMLGCSPDLDGDGYSARVDCDDSDPEVHPDARERCLNGIDDDCSNTADVDGVDPAPFYADADGDGFGDESRATMLCRRPVGDDLVETGGDCDDNNPDRNPGVAADLCNDVDDDCDQEIDEDAEFRSLFLDRDGDGYGDGDAFETCKTEGLTSRSGDCDDDDEEAHPGAIERCNLSDDDCDGLVDEAVLGTGMCPAESCKQILALNPESRDGRYILDFGEPYGNVDVQCRMESEPLKGWTVLDQRALNENDLVTFSLVDGQASRWSGEWSLGQIELYPRKERSEGCEPAVLRASVDLPFEFDAWYGEFSADYEGYDVERGDMGVAGTRCGHGSFLFGVDDDSLIKRPGTWGLVEHPQLFDVSWEPTLLDPPRSSFLWELNGARIKVGGLAEQGDSVSIRIKEIAVH